MRTYWAILQRPPARHLALVMLPVRLGYAMAALALVLMATERTGSASVGGAALGLFSLGAGLLGPVRGRIVDRYGQTKPLLIYVPFFCCGFAALTLMNDPWPVLVTATVSGAMSPPLLASSRPLWRSVVPPELVRGAFALDSTSMQVTMIAGPALAGAIATATSPAVAILTVSALVLVGGAAFVAMPASRAWPSTTVPPALSKLLRAPGFSTLLFLGALAGVVGGALVVVLPHVALRFSTPLGAGLLLSIMSVGSIVGGVLAGARHSTVTARGGLISMMILALALTPLAFALNAPLPVLAGLLLLVGGGLGPAAVYLLELVDAIAPPGTTVTAFAGIVALEGATVAIGAIGSGYAIDAGRPELGILLAATCAALAALTYWRLGRRTSDASASRAAVSAETPSMAG